VSQSDTGLAELARRQLILVTGKGGVGKSAVAATLGRLLAERGRHTLLIELDPRESLHQMFDSPPSGGAIQSLRPGLFLQNLQPRQVLDRIVRQQVKIEWLAQRVQQSPVYDHFTAGAPGLKELAVLGHSLQLIRGRVEGAPAIDTVIIDAPATGHGVSLLAAPQLLLAAPQLVADVIQEGPFGRMTGEVAAFVGDPALCGVVVVTLAEEMPVTEALELRRALAEALDRAPELLVVNALYPPFTESGKELSPDSDAAGVLWRDRRRVNETEMARLEEAWEGRSLQLPLLPLDRGPALIDELVERFESAVGGDS